MADILILLILAVILVFAVRSSVNYPHLKADAF